MLPTELPFIALPIGILPMGTLPIDRMHTLGPATAVPHALPTVRRNTSSATVCITVTIGAADTIVIKGTELTAPNSPTIPIGKARLVIVPSAVGDQRPFTPIDTTVRACSCCIGTIAAVLWSTT